MPSTRQELIEYGKRQLGHPVLEINIADEQIEDNLDDTIIFYQDRHMDGVEKMYLKHKITKDFTDTIQATSSPTRKEAATGLTTTTSPSVNITGVGTTTFSFEETQNFIQVPDAVIGIEKVWKVDSRAIASNMFNITYQLFLNEIYYFSSMELLSYTQTKRYLEDIDFILHPDKQIRFNRRQNRLYIDSDYSSMKEDDYLIIECYRVLDPNDYPKVYNDRWIKNYFTAKLKKQWGQNLIKFQGVKLPGGVELNGRQIYEDGVAEIQALEDKMTTEYELPPLDFIG
tara:strand:- start:13671 stop:14525 length:855 start_codon:yes stop_codon:yes gene_type:complete